MSCHILTMPPLTADLAPGERSLQLSVLPVHGWPPVLALCASFLGEPDAWAITDWLSDVDARQLRRYTVERRRRDVLRGRRAAYLAVARQFPDLPRSCFHIENGVFEQPVWAGQGTGPISLSISHAKGLAAAVAAPGGFPMGVDVEQINARNLQTLANQMTEPELDLIRHLIPEKLDLALTLLWCAKEAVSKALRCGLTCPMTLLEIDTVTETTDGLGWSGTFRNFYQYRFHAWCPTSDHVLALVMDRRCSLSLPMEGTV